MHYTVHYMGMLTTHIYQTLKCGCLWCRRKGGRVSLRRQGRVCRSKEAGEGERGREGCVGVKRQGRGKGAGEGV